MGATAPAVSSKTMFGHPKGLFVLFVTEMWERFSFYGMRALLVYYMIKHLMFTQEKASQIWGLYAGFVWFTPLFGGMLADRVLGQRKTVILGGVIMAIGHFLMAFESMFYPALVCIILGNGAFKPNISTQVGNLYPEGDSRSDRAFSIFYVGINIGALLSPLVCGTLGEVYGWHWGFGAAGVGMIIGLLVYIWGQKHLAPDSIMKAKAEGTSVKKPLTSTEKSSLWALVALCAFNILFWMNYEQQGNTLALWADANSDRHIFGGAWEMPATWFQAVNPFMIFLFTPFLNKFWERQAKKGTEPTSITKMAMGCIFLGLSFVVMVPAARAYANVGIASFWWLVLCMVFATLGELYLSPVGLSLVTKVAPARMVSMVMGMWFLSSFFGDYLSGYIGMYWEKMSKENFFLLSASIAFVGGIGMLSLLKPLKKAMGWHTRGHFEKVEDAHAQVGL